MMQLNSILKKSVNTDTELYKLAKLIDVPKLKVMWLRDYNSSMYDEPVILNLGLSSQGGTHFVATYKDWYFDSMGMVPPRWKGLEKKQWSPIQIQPYNQGHCGVYALIFLKYAMNNDVDGFYSQFKALNLT